MYSKRLRHSQFIKSSGLPFCSQVVTLCVWVGWKWLYDFECCIFLGSIPSRWSGTLWVCPSSPLHICRSFLSALLGLIHWCSCFSPLTNWLYRPEFFRWFGCDEVIRHRYVYWSTWCTKSPQFLVQFFYLEYSCQFLFRSILQFDCFVGFEYSTNSKRSF